MSDQLNEEYFPGDVVWFNYEDDGEFIDVFIFISVHEKMSEVHTFGRKAMRFNGGTMKCATRIDRV